MNPLAFMETAIYPTKHLLVGIEDDQDGSLRVYFDARYLNLHTHTSDAEQIAKVRAAWAAAGDTVVDVPSEVLCDCPPPASGDAGSET